MDIRRPIWLQRVHAPGAEAFALLFATESFARSLVVSALPVEGLRLLGDPQRVSVLFFAVSLCGILATITVPWLVRRLARRWVYTLGALSLCCAPLVMMGGTTTFLALGLWLRVTGIVMTTVCVSLYILDHIERDDFSRSEPIRMMFAGAAWMVGPTLGGWLGEVYGNQAAFLTSSCVCVLMIAYFWHLRIADKQPLMSFKGESPNPLRFFGRFRQQPRLVVAWCFALGRYVWWTVFFVYIPIYAVQSGLGQFIGGVIISVGSSFMLLLPILGRLVRRYGIRKVFIMGFGVSAIATVAMSFTMATPWLAIGILMVATFAMVVLDAIGNLTFMYAVRHHERSEMTAVYSTYRDAGEVLAPGVFAILLKFFALPVVFASTGVLMAGFCALSRVIHPRLGKA